MTNSQKFIIDTVTNKILDGLKENRIAWIKGWITSPMQNYKSKTGYSLFNTLLLMITSQERQYKSPYWITYRQLLSLKGGFKSYEDTKKYTTIYYTDYILLYNGYTISPDKYKTLSTDQQKQVFKKAYLKNFRLYNFEQTKNIPDIEVKNDIKPQEKAEKLINNYKECPTINFLGSQPYYNKADDTIQIPAINKFKSIDEYYSTLYHELTHSTGSEKRLNRDSMKKYSRHDHTRNIEELTAEIGSGFLCLTVGIDKTIENNIAYCQSWYKEIKNNPEMLKTALTEANNSYKYILKNSA